jgi:hypothetical protein
MVFGNLEFQSHNGPIISPPEKVLVISKRLRQPPALALRGLFLSHHSLSNSNRFASKYRLRIFLKKTLASQFVVDRVRISPKP